MTLDRKPTVIARTVTRLVVPMILVTAIALLLQGHNLPPGDEAAAGEVVTLQQQRDSCHEYHRDDQSRHGAGDDRRLPVE